jgi:hypothetical protein
MSARSTLPLVAALALATGCAGAADLGVYSGACDTQHDRCASRCAELREPIECERRCTHVATRCQSRAGGAGRAVFGAASRGIGDHQVRLIALEDKVPVASKGVTFRVTQGAKPGVNAFDFPPGARLEAKILLPAGTREADLLLTHAPGAGGTCFITLLVDGETLVGRYSPPPVKDGGLREETWPLTPLLPAPKPGEPDREMTLFLFNNDAAGSTGTYRLRSVQVTYRAIEPRPSR